LSLSDPPMHWTTWLFVEAQNDGMQLIRSQIDEGGESMPDREREPKRAALVDDADGTRRTPSAP